LKFSTNFYSATSRLIVDYFFHSRLIFSRLVDYSRTALLRSGGMIPFFESDGIYPVYCAVWCPSAFSSSVGIPQIPRALPDFNLPIALTTSQSIAESSGVEEADWTSWMCWWAGEQLLIILAPASSLLSLVADETPVGAENRAWYVMTVGS